MTTIGCIGKRMACRYLLMATYGNRKFFVENDFQMKC